MTDLIPSFWDDILSMLIPKCHFLGRKALKNQNSIMFIFFEWFLPNHVILDFAQVDFSKKNFCSIFPFFFSKFHPFGIILGLSTMKTWPGGDVQFSDHVGAWAGGNEFYAFPAA